MEKQITTIWQFPKISPRKQREDFYFNNKNNIGNLSHGQVDSGTTAIACLKLNRKFIGIDKEPEYCRIAEGRIFSYIAK